MSRYAHSANQGVGEKYSELLEQRHIKPVYNKYSETIKILQLDTEEQSLNPRTPAYLNSYTTYPFIHDPYMSASGMTSGLGRASIMAGAPPAVEGGLGFDPSLTAPQPQMGSVPMMNMAARMMMTRDGGAPAGTTGPGAQGGGYRHDGGWGGGFIQAQPARAAVGTAPAMQSNAWREIQYHEPMPMAAGGGSGSNGGGDYYSHGGAFQVMRSQAETTAVRLNPNIRNAYFKEAALNRVVAGVAGGGTSFAFGGDYGIPMHAPAARAMGGGGANAGARGSAFDRNIALRRRPQIDGIDGQTQDGPKMATPWREVTPPERAPAVPKDSDVIDLTKRLAGAKTARGKPEPVEDKAPDRDTSPAAPDAPKKPATQKNHHFREVKEKPEPKADLRSKTGSATAPRAKSAKAIPPAPSFKPKNELRAKTPAPSFKSTETKAKVEPAKKASAKAKTPAVKVEDHTVRADKEMTGIYTSHFHHPNTDAEDARFNELMGRLEKMRARIEAGKSLKPGLVRGGEAPSGSA